MAAPRDRTDRRAEERAIAKQESRDIEDIPEIPESLRPILRQLPVEQRRTLVTYIEHKGPIPSPWMLEQYKAIDPTLPGIFAQSFLDQQAHRQRMESIILPEQAHQSARGQWMAFGSVALFLGTTITCALTGHDGVAMVTGGATAVSIVTAFLSSRQKN
jgi:hypothetical protein